MFAVTSMASEGRWAGVGPKFEEFIRHAKERRPDNPAERPLA
jgi:hypothetical protein